MKASQADRVLDMLKHGTWVCSNEFVRAYMPRFSNAIWILRHQRGYGIEGRACQQGHDHDGGVYEFRITRWPESATPKEQLTWIA